MAKNVFALYRIRFKLAAVLNITETVEAVLLITDMRALEKSKPRHKAAFRNLLFALAARCNRLLEEILIGTRAIQDRGGVEWEGLAGIGEFITGKRKEMRHSQLLLEKGLTGEALLQLAKAKAGLGELAARMDAIMESEMKLETRRQKLGDCARIK